MFSTNVSISSITLFKADKKNYNCPITQLLKLNAMSVTIPKEAEQFVESEVAAGHVNSTDDVIMQALELYQLRQQYIEEQIGQGIEDMEAGRSRPYSPQVLEDVKQNALKMIASRKSLQ